jgi:nucleoside-diphosphate-sugar epimerase
MAPQRTVPTPVAIALATAVGTVDRLHGRSSELNAATILYLTRTGGYSRVKAERLLGWVPQVSLDEGMARTEAWLRAEGHLTRT